MIIGIDKPIIESRSHRFASVLRLYDGETELRFVESFDVRTGIGRIIGKTNADDRLSSSECMVTRISIATTATLRQRHDFVAYADRWREQSAVEFSLPPGDDAVVASTCHVLKSARAGARAEMARAPSSQLIGRDFPARNAYAEKPEYFDDADGQLFGNGSYPVQVHGHEIATVWTLTAAQRRAVALGADIALICYGSQPPVRLHTYFDAKPNAKEGKAKNV